MSDTPRESSQDDVPTGRLPLGGARWEAADEPVTGAPAGAAGSAGSDSAAGGQGLGPFGSGQGTRPAGGAQAPGPVGGGQDQSRLGGGQPSGLAGGAQEQGPAVGAQGPRQRRRRRWFIVGISVVAAVIVLAVCAGALSIISAVDDVRDRAAEAHEERAVRRTDCLDLERRLNRLIPPGATNGPAARATAIRDENSAVRIYVDQLDSQRDEDAWRQLLDARTVYADALDRQAKSRTPAFYVAPRTTDGLAVTDELVRWSPAPCAGSIRRLAAPEL